MKVNIPNKNKVIIVAMFTILIVLSIIVILTVVQARKKEKAELQKIENDYNGEFAYDCVTVLTSKERHELNREYALDEFPEVKLVAIENLNVENEEGDFLLLYLKKPSKENAIKAVYRLKSNPIVVSSELNGIEHIDE